MQKGDCNMTSQQLLYKVETKALNQKVKRNVARFPERFRFQLTKLEMQELVTNCDRFRNLKHSTSPSYAFTEQGISMLSAVVNSQKAIDTSIKIMDAFVGMRRYLSARPFPDNRQYCLFIRSQLERYGTWALRHHKVDCVS